MKINPIFKKKPKIEFTVSYTLLNPKGERWVPKFKIDNQTFSLAGVETSDEAKWFNEQLSNALDKLK